MISLESWVVGQFYITLDTKPIGENLTAEEGLTVKKWFESAYKEIVELVNKPKEEELEKLNKNIEELNHEIEHLEGCLSEYED